jgi:hypothetical protein
MVTLKIVDCSSWSTDEKETPNYKLVGYFFHTTI